MSAQASWLDLRTAEIPQDVGNKGKLLAQAARRGLPVPRGILLLEAGGKLPADLPTWLTERPLAIRSAFHAEDRADSSLAGFFETVLNVDGRDAQALEGALQQVWRSAERQAGEFRRDILIMQMVDAHTAGVAFTQSNYLDDLINYTAGLADKLVGGQTEGKRHQLPKKGPVEAGWPRRLQQLLQQVRRVFGAAEWDIEWADDGTHCWLIQIRPITRPPRRNEAFTYANTREILPDPPSRYMSSVVAACSDGLYAYYRGFDPTLPRSRPMIEQFAHRPFFNLSLLTETMRHWGLPTALVTNSIGGEADVEMGLNLPQFLRKTLVLLRQGWAQLTAVGHSHRATQEILARTRQPGESFRAVGESFTWLFTRLVTEMFNLTAALSAPLLILRLTNTLAAHAPTHHAISTAIYSDLAPLRELVAARPELRPALEAGRLPADLDFQQLWGNYLDKHGHRGVYESDIARPRYQEAPQPLLTTLLTPPPEANPPKRRSPLAWLTLPVWWQCRRVLDAREWWRYQSMVCYARVRQQLIRLAEEAVDAGQLPSVEHLWRLTLEETVQLDDGWVPDGAFWAQREGEIADAAAYDLPDLLHRLDDLEPYREGAQAGAHNGRWRGVSLTDGEVRGRAWVLKEPASRLPDGFTAESTILVARSVDAGWISTFAQVSGVAVEIGGDLSHGSIILREIGLPAVTNVKGITRGLQTGDRVVLRAGNGVVELNE